MRETINPKIVEAAISLLERSTSLDIDNFEAMEVYLRCIVSIALDSAHGDNALAAQWIDEWLLPNITKFRDTLAHGGMTPPCVVSGRRIN